MMENGIMDDPNLAILVTIAQALGDLCKSLVFVGGCATGLFNSRLQFGLYIFTSELF